LKKKLKLIGNTGLQRFRGKLNTFRNLAKSFLGTDFNRIMNQLGLPFNIAGPVVVRLKSDINQSTGDASTIPSINGSGQSAGLLHNIIHVLFHPK